MKKMILITLIFNLVFLISNAQEQSIRNTYTSTDGNISIGQTITTNEGYTFSMGIRHTPQGIDYYIDNEGKMENGEWLWAWNLDIRAFFVMIDDPDVAITFCPFSGYYAQTEQESISFIDVPGFSDGYTDLTQYNEYQNNYYLVFEASEEFTGLLKYRYVIGFNRSSTNGSYIIDEELEPHNGGLK